MGVGETELLSWCRGRIEKEEKEREGRGVVGRKSWSGESLLYIY